MGLCGEGGLNSTNGKRECGANCRGRCTLRTLSIPRASDWTTRQAGLHVLGTQPCPRPRFCRERAGLATGGKGSPPTQTEQGDEFHKGKKTGPLTVREGGAGAFSEDGLNESISSAQTRQEGAE